MAFIRTVSFENATGMLKRLYDEAMKRAGRIWNVVRLMSINPRTLRASMGLYTATLHSPSPLSRAQREMIATVVSRTNNCFY
jgi:alkylhydroperoxidase family enzyme